MKIINWWKKNEWFGFPDSLVEQMNRAKIIDSKREKFAKMGLYLNIPMYEIGIEAYTYAKPGYQYLDEVACFFPDEEKEYCKCV